MSAFDQDWVISQALAGLNISSELTRLRKVHEGVPRKARRDFQELRAETQAVNKALQITRQGFTPEPFTADDLLGSAAVELKELAAEFHRRALAEEAFRVRHGLPRMADAVQNMLSTLIILLLAVVIEGGVNTSFLLNAQLAASPVSAILFSLLVSVTNVFFSAWAGYYIGRWKKYGAHATDADNPEFVAIRRQAHWQFVVCVVVWILLHSTLGLVRAQETLDSVAPSLMGYLSIITTPEALFLVLTGVGMSVLSYHKGMTAFSDPYPNYSNFHDATQYAKEDFQEGYESCITEIEDRHAAARQSLDRSWKEQCKEQGKVGKLHARCLEARRELVRVVDEAESALSTDIARLAETHRAARGESQPLPEAGLNQLASYQNFLEDSEPPALDVPPNIHDYRSALDEIKASALYELRSLFENLHATNGGHSS
ncbi:MAG: hypothetical protein ABW092_17055 [Candidatus Thiodiazotropha sp.]